MLWLYSQLWLKWWIPFNDISSPVRLQLRIHLKSQVKSCQVRLLWRLNLYWIVIIRKTFKSSFMELWKVYDNNCQIRSNNVVLKEPLSPHCHLVLAITYFLLISEDGCEYIKYSVVTVMKWKIILAQNLRKNSNFIFPQKGTVNEM